MLSFIFPLRIPACYTHSDPFPVYLFCCTGPMSSFVKLYKASKQRQPKTFGERQAKYFLRWRGDFMPDPAIMSRLSSPCTISRKREDFKAPLCRQVGDSNSKSRHYITFNSYIPSNQLASISQKSHRLPASWRGPGSAIYLHAEFPLCLNDSFA